MFIKIRKFTSAVLCVAILGVGMAFLAACGGEVDIGEQPLNIALIIAPGGAYAIEDEQFDALANAGIAAFTATSPRSNVSPREFRTLAAAMEELAAIAGDYAVIILPGSQFAGIGQIAIDNPSTNFILLDAHPTPVGGRSSFDNVLALRFYDEHAGFVAGVVAALETQTGAVGFVGGVPSVPIVNYQLGFESGVVFANAYFGTTAEIVDIPALEGRIGAQSVGGNYIGSLTDSARGIAVANYLIEEGVDTIFVAAGLSSRGSFLAAAENGNVMIIGADRNQFGTNQFDRDTIWEGQIFLTSVLRRFDLAVRDALNDAAMGEFAGGNVRLGASGGYIGFVSIAGQHAMSSETISRVNTVITRLAEGAIVPASHENAHTSAMFPGHPASN